MQKNDIYEIVIENISEDGNGIGKVPGDGRVVFCKGALPGETVSAQIIKITKSYAVARTCDIIKSSPDRITPDCDVFGKCGGCSFRHFNYSAQLKSKEHHVRDCIERIGGFSLSETTPEGNKIEFLPIIGMDRPEKYRNKAIFPFGASAVAEQSPEKAVCGFFRKNSHSIVEIKNCMLENNMAEKVRASVLEFVRSRNLSIYDESTGKGLIRSLMVRTSRNQNNAMVVLVVTRKPTWIDEFVQSLIQNCPFVASVYFNINSTPGNVVMSQDFIHVFGTKTLQDSILGTKFDISPMSFYQVNPVQTEKLYNAAIDFADICGGENLLDIYCGIGTIGLCMANHAQKRGTPLASLTGIEYVEQAIIDARHNAKLNNIKNTEFYAGDAGEVLAALTNAGKISKSFDTVILDPPRKGCDEKLLDTAILVNPQKIVYVSCNPATLARDLKYLAQKGYMPKKIQAVDMFPHTGHVETVVLLSHKKPDGHINVKVEFGEGKDKVSLDNIAERAEQYKPKEKVTYSMIKSYIEEKYGFKVHTAYIAEVKRELGLPMYDTPNAVEELKHPRKHPTPEKVKAIKDALKYFEII